MANRATDGVLHTVAPSRCLMAAASAIASVLAMASGPGAETVVFTDVTDATGITFAHVSSPDKKYILESMSGGVALFDFDHDGWLDVYFANAPTVATAGNPRSARSGLWRNRGDGTFADATDAAGVGFPGWAMGAVAADVDADGWDDLYVTCYGPNRLYRNNGDGTFSDITTSAGVGDRRWSTGAAFADYDGDGGVDLFVANYADVALDALPEFGKGRFCEFNGTPVQCGPRGLPGSGDALFRNRGNGTFEDVSTGAGVADAEGRFGLGVVWSDFDGDGRADLFVANDAGSNFLYRNLGTGAFAEVALLAGTAVDENGKDQGSMGVAVGDYDHSGGGSLFVTNFADEYNALYRHGRAFEFTDASRASRTASPGVPLVGWGTHFLDYDNDGWLDLLVVNGHVYPQVERVPGARYAQPLLLFRSLHDGTFADETSAAGAALSTPAVSRGSAVGDLDNDGDLDVVINNLDGAPTVLRNDGGNRRRFLTVDLRGQHPNSGAIGAVVTVTAGALMQRAEVRTSDSYLSHSDPRLHFGLADERQVDRLEIRWPGGGVQQFREIPVNSFVRITQGEADVRRVVAQERGRQ
jgi:hypothetical protein